MRIRTIFTTVFFLTLLVGIAAANVYYPIGNVTINNFNNSYDFTSNSNAATFYNATNVTSNSNTTIFYNASFTNETPDLTSYAYLPGRDGGQTLTGGTDTGNLVLNGSANNGDVIINSGGAGNVIVGSSIGDEGTLNVIRSGTIASLVIKSTSTTSSYSPFFSFYRAKGTILSPIVLTSGNRIGTISFAGYDGISYTAVSQFISAAEESWSSTAQGTNFQWTTTGIKSTLRTEKMRLTANGSLLIGTTTTNQTAGGLDVAGETRFRSCSGTPTMDALGQMTCASDPKLKTAVTTYTSDTAKVAAITPISYKWNAASGYDTTHTNTGFDAAQIQTIYPECIIARDDVAYSQVCDNEEECTTVEKKTGSQTLAIDDKCLIAILFNSAKEQRTQITSLQDQNKKQDERITALELKLGVKP